MKKIKGDYKIKASRSGKRFTITLYKRFWKLWIPLEWVSRSSIFDIEDEAIDFKDCYNIIKIEDEYEILEDI